MARRRWSTPSSTSCAAIGSATVARGQCLELSGASEAYLPFLDAFGRLLREPRHAALVALLRRYAPTWLRQMPSLVQPGERAALDEEVRGATRERMLREMAEAIEALSAEQPLVLVLEDLHWSDNSTVDLSRRWRAAASRRGCWSSAPIGRARWCSTAIRCAR